MSVDAYLLDACRHFLAKLICFGDILTPIAVSGALNITICFDQAVFTREAAQQGLDGYRSFG